MSTFDEAAELELYDAARMAKCAEALGAWLARIAHEREEALRAERDATQKRLDDLVAYVKQVEADCRVLAKEAKRLLYLVNAGTGPLLEKYPPAVREAMERWE